MQFNLQCTLFLLLRLRLTLCYLDRQALIVTTIPWCSPIVFLIFVYRMLLLFNQEKVSLKIALLTYTYVLLIEFISISNFLIWNRDKEQIEAPSLKQTPNLDQS